jgi:hypothetical protein
LRERCKLPSMRTPVIACFAFCSFALCAAPGFGQTVSRLSDPVAPASAYNLVFHVTHSFFATDAANGSGPGSFLGPRRDIAEKDLHLVGVLDGKNIDVAGGPVGWGQYGLLPVGDYRVRLIENKQKKDGSITQAYDLLLPKKHHEAFTLVGNFE